MCAEYLYKVSYIVPGITCDKNCFNAAEKSCLRGGCHVQILDAEVQIIKSVYNNVLADGSGHVVVNETRLPTVVREMTSTSPKPLIVDDSEIDASLTDNSHLSSADPASQNVDGNTMLGAVNRVADVSFIIIIIIECF